MESVERSGRPGFNPSLRHTKDFKNGTWYLLAYHLEIYGTYQE